MRKRILIAGLIVCGAVAAGPAQQVGHVPVSMVEDWSSRHVIFTEAVPRDLRGQILMEPRFWHQYFRRHQTRPLPSWDRDFEHDRDRDGGGDRRRRRRHPKPAVTQRDWSVNLNNGSGGVNAAPSKYAFDITAAPSCTTDFIVLGILVAGSANQANLIGLNNLYSNAGGTGFCSGTGPKFMFAYNVGPGTIRGYTALSLDGKKVAFNETAPNNGTAYFHVLTFQSGTGNGTGASAAVVPGTGNTAVDTKIVVTAGVTTSPYVDYINDVAYITADDNTVHKYKNIFRGTPSEVTTGGWPVTANPGNGAVISSPIFDGVSKHLFFTDSGGGLDYVDDSVSPPVVHTGGFVYAPGGNNATPPIVDSSRQLVYAFSGNPGGANAVVAQADTNLSAASQVTANVGSNSNNVIRQGDFNNAYYTGGASTTAFMYVVGNDRTGNQRPALYNIGFNASFKLNTTTANGPLTLSTNTAGVLASPITEFFNSRLNKDFLFVGVSNACMVGIGGGCIRTLDITAGFPASANTVVLAASGGPGSITIDNNSGSAEASSVYYMTQTGNMVVKATQAALQ